MTRHEDGGVVRRDPLGHAAGGAGPGRRALQPGLPGELAGGARRHRHPPWARRPGPERSVFKADILKINDVEALDLARMFDLPARTPEAVAGEVLRRWGLKACVVTLGAQGAYAVAGADEARVPGWNVDVVDTIGSG